MIILPIPNFLMVLLLCRNRDIIIIINNNKEFWTWTTNVWLDREAGPRNTWPQEDRTVTLLTAKQSFLTFVAFALGRFIGCGPLVGRKFHEHLHLSVCALPRQFRVDFVAQSVTHLHETCDGRILVHGVCVEFAQRFLSQLCDFVQQ